MSTSAGIAFIIGKAAIWLLLPLALGIWELRRHRRMMARGEERPAALPRWLTTTPAERRAAHRPARPAATPAPAPSDAEREAA